MPESIRLSLKRRVVQCLSLGIIGEWSFYGIFRCPFAVPYIGCGNCPVIQCPGRSLWMWSWIFIAALTLVFGRAFCGWICPGGLVQDLLAPFAFLRQKVSGLMEKILGPGKYLLLFSSLWVFFIMANPRGAIPIRTGDFFGAVGLTFEHASFWWLTRTVAILAALGLGLLIPHFWCRFLCPTGAAQDLFRKIALFRFAMTPSCTDCNHCKKVCALETRPGEASCTQCGDCKSVCPHNAIVIRPLLEIKKGGEEIQV